LLNIVFLRLNRNLHFSGPKTFYDGKHFAMVLGSPIVVTIFDEKNPTRKLSTVKLDAPAMSVKGSMINTDKTDFKVNLDWKQQVGTLESFIKNTM